MEYTLTQLADQPEGSYLLIDIRDEGSYDYGSIDGAVNMPDVLSEAQAGHLPRDRKLVLMCMHEDERFCSPDDCEAVLLQVADSVRPVR